MLVNADRSCWLGHGTGCLNLNALIISIHFIYLSLTLRCLVTHQLDVISCLTVSLNFSYHAFHDFHVAIYSKFDANAQKSSIITHCYITVKIWFLRIQTFSHQKGPKGWMFLRLNSMLLQLQHFPVSHFAKNSITTSYFEIKCFSHMYIIIINSHFSYRCQHEWRASSR